MRVQNSKRVNAHDAGVVSAKDKLLLPRHVWSYYPCPRLSTSADMHTQTTVVRARLRGCDEDQRQANHTQSTSIPKKAHTKHRGAMTPCTKRMVYIISGAELVASCFKTTIQTRGPRFPCTPHFTHRAPPGLESDLGKEPRNRM